LRTYELSAYCTPTEKLEQFDEDLTISMNYSDSDIIGTKESSLVIYRYDTVNSVWKVLENCNIDMVSNIVSCDTSHFSTFGIFGENELVTTSNSSSN
jgi:hypothetical protein